MHGWMWWIIVGLVSGALAKALMPGEKNEPKGCLMTMLLGVGGAMIVGFLLHNVLGWRTGGQFIGSIVGATIGAMLLIFIFRKTSKS
jgi:uncharacterized membrane protein YeaQ/YmgE (transglycosylase-associated protein family)